MTYEVRTAVFEGPLDLLLQLITRHQVDITHLSLTSLVTEYVGHLEAMREMDLEVTSEFLLIASTLIQLKARALLPDDADVDLDEEIALFEERDRLLARLLACATFKDVAAVLAHRLTGRARYLPRTAGIDIDVRPVDPEIRLGVSPAAFSRLAGRVMARSEEPDLDHLDLDLPSVPLAIDDLRRRLREEVEGRFDDLTAHLTRTVEVAAYFLAMLELARWGLIEVSQDHRDAPIQLRARTDADIEVLESEWV
ncbi:MAG: segregation/condensation protein A [Acidimicrobiia bacterium]|nr:segregation/condensation protein A [Acidimicrobiia bacterium]MBT8217359.1 segregation/condensation protein A [Acidimicrobiia bacterium]NNF10185.1 segregation/condensation protein A [Acidimicrobiia bacterium]NNL69081.1 segregation/condensation protein A [Acidimicrobiia bacterium]